MKTMFRLTLTLLIFSMFAFVPNSFAQDPSPEYVVRVIYFYPSDHQPHPDIDSKLSTLMKTIQKLYADNMERHDFGRKTFRLETDESENVIVHSVKGKFANMHYDRSSSSEVHNEISEHFDISKNIMYFYWIDLYDPIVDNYSFSGSSAHKWAQITSTNFDFEKASEDDYISAHTVIAHELGHNFGLHHDFRDDHDIMSYGDFRYVTQDQLSYCAAEWLDVHRYFNDTQGPFEQLPTILMHTPHFISLPNTIRLSFDITHSERLHQAQLLTNSLTWTAPGISPILLACKSLDEKRETIEFNTTELAQKSEYVTLRVIDVHGNIAEQSFPININSLVPDSAAVSIPDLNLAAAIRESLGLASGSAITQLDMQGLRLLYADEKQITSLTGLEHAFHLEELKLDDNQITDITSLAGLTQLRVLTLRGNEISDISPLTDLKQLKVLSLSSNKLSDISPLTDLKQLKVLGLNSGNNGNEISDISPLTDLKQLTKLWLDGNEISDISPLADLKQLTELTLNGCRMISDISPLTDLKQLSYLHIGFNEIRDIGPLAKLTRLRSLILYVNQIEDISPLAKLTRLQVLWLARNNIRDISPLAKLTRLYSLHLDSNEITDVNPVIGLTELIELRLSQNPISDVRPLVGLTKLETLSLVGTQIKNRKPLLALLRENPDIKIFLKNYHEPLPVTLSVFRAEHTDAGVVIKWITESEIDNAGFYIYRSETKEGEFKVVNPSMIQGAGTTGERNEYTWTDTTAKPNIVYYYRIEDVSHAGERKQLATVRLRGLVSASGKLTICWADLKIQN